MLTLRIRPRSGKSSPRRNGGFPAPVSPRSDDLPTTTEACPYCPRNLTEYRFTTDDGLPIITYHCAEHGDVIPMYSIIMNHNEEENLWK